MGRPSVISPGGAGYGAWGSSPDSWSATAGISTTRWPSACPTVRSTFIARGISSSGSGFGFAQGGPRGWSRHPGGGSDWRSARDMIHRRVWDDYRGPDRPGRDLGRLARFRLARERPEALAARPRRPAGRRDPREGHARPGPRRSSSPTSAVPRRPRSRSSACRSPTGSVIAFAGRSSICDGREQAPAIAGIGPLLLISEITLPRARGSHPCRITFPSAAEAHLIRWGSFLLSLMGSLIYWWESRQPPANPKDLDLPRRTPARLILPRGPMRPSREAATMRFDETSVLMEVEQIRQICAEWGLDGEMTALILRSHGRDRARHVPLGGTSTKTSANMSSASWQPGKPSSMARSADNGNRSSIPRDRVGS